MVLKNSCIHLRIKGSKTDPFRQGVTLFIAPTHCSICPVHALERHLSRANVRKAPLFCIRNGSFLTRNRVFKTIKAALRSNCIDTCQYSSHSFGIGAASTAAAAGIYDSLIRLLGRWCRYHFNTYIRITKSKLYKVPKKLASGQAVSKV